MKITLSLLLALALPTGLISAQQADSTTNTPSSNLAPPPEGAGQGKGHRPDFMAKLNLTDAQKAQIAQIR